MYPFVKPMYRALDVTQRKELCANSYKICSATLNWTAATKHKVLELMNKSMQSFPFIKNDIGSCYDELDESNSLIRIPFSAIHCVRSYFEQFYVIKDKKLCLPKLPIQDKPRGEIASYGSRTSAQTASAYTKVKAITEEIWWVIRVKTSYRMCRLTFDRGEWWEMVEYQNGKVHNPRYKFPKYDNRVVYEFREHITPDKFDAKIEEAVQIRKAALLRQAEDMLLRFNTVIIARHPTEGTLVGGVEEEDDTYWYLDTYNEHGEHIFFGDNRWELVKKSRCAVVQILRRK